MELTKDKLLYLWQIRHTIFNDEKNREIIERFDRVNDLFKEMESMTIGFRVNGEETEVTIDGKRILKRDGNNPDAGYFACEDDGMAAQGAFNGVKNMMEAFPEYSDIIERIGCLLGGFDKNRIMREEFRIISNTIKDGHDRNTLVSVGQSRHPSSNFADNNYFFRVIEAIQAIEKGTFNPDESKIVLRYPHETYYGSHDQENFWENAEKEQKEALNHRFPYKFFYMWTHRDNVIHLVGLKAYRELIYKKDPPFDSFIGDKGMNQTYYDFTAQWENYSKKIISVIQGEETEDESNMLSDLSKLLSIVLSKPIDIKNMLDLLESGNKAIVLWGPPGTGKTFSAKQLISNKLGISKETLNQFKFNNKTVHLKGAWEIVQFHPNYSYEDFIGGISPKLDGDNLTYRLKEGIFKKMCDEANKPEHKDKSFILIVDEINRADLSSVFGELMYALEYRGEEISIPNFENSFVIPENVYLIGTMNSVDKSLTTFDLALRRRFGFYKLMPDVNVLPEILSEKNVSDKSITAFIDRCRELNDYISDNSQILNLGEEYQIGHAYFAKIKDFIPTSDEEVEISSFDMEKLWIYHLEPLLEEYVGNRIEDQSVKGEIDNLKRNFIRNFEVNG